MMQNSDQARMFHRIDVISFICIEMQLYLDTHPYEEDAIAYFNRNMQRLNQLKREYSRMYTPLTLAYADTDSQKWKWVLDPMPWEGGCYSMWNYEKRLQFPVNIKEPNPKIAQIIISQYGGPDGEMGASMRYLSQRYATPYREVAGTMTDIGTEELGHLEMVATIVHQLTRNMTMEQLKESGFDKYYVDHTIGIWPQAAGGVPFNACEFQSKGDIITDLVEDMAAEQKARSTYDNILRLVKDPDVCEPIKFLRAREIVHFQRFGEALRITQDKLDSKNFYACNPGFDTNCPTGCGCNSK